MIQPLAMIALLVAIAILKDLPLAHLAVQAITCHHQELQYAIFANPALIMVLLALLNATIAMLVNMLR